MYPFPAEVWAEAMSMTHSGIWYAVSSGYFYVPFLWAIAVSGFQNIKFKFFKFIKTQAFSCLLTITLTVSSHADIHSYKCIYLFQIYSMKSVFLLKFMLSFFILNIQKNSIEYCFCSRLCKNYWITCCTHRSHVVWADEIQG